MRMIALSNELHIPVQTESNWHSMKLIHEMGKATHRWIKEQILEQTPNVYGYWKCLCGKHRVGPCTYSDQENPYRENLVHVNTLLLNMPV